MAPKSTQTEDVRLGDESMRIVKDAVTIDELKQMATRMFGDMVKAVVDVERELMAVDADLHADLESALLSDGSQQPHLWGINLYPELPDDQFLEFDSMINLRPSQGNRSRGVEDETIRRRIAAVVKKNVVR